MQEGLFVFRVLSISRSWYFILEDVSSLQSSFLLCQRDTETENKHREQQGTRDFRSNSTRISENDKIRSPTLPIIQENILQKRKRCSRLSIIQGLTERYFLKALQYIRKKNEKKILNYTWQMRKAKRGKEVQWMVANAGKKSVHCETWEGHLGPQPESIQCHFLTNHVLPISLTYMYKKTQIFSPSRKKLLFSRHPIILSFFPFFSPFADSFISIKFEDDGVASWEKTKAKKAPVQDCTNKPLRKETKGTKSVVEHSKPRGTLRWRKRIGHLFQLIRWKRSSKANVCHVEGVKVMRKGWIRTLTKRKTKE